LLKQSGREGEEPPQSKGHYPACEGKWSTITPKKKAGNDEPLQGPEGRAKAFRRLSFGEGVLDGFVQKKVKLGRKGRKWDHAGNLIEKKRGREPREGEKNCKSFYKERNTPVALWRELSASGMGGKERKEGQFGTI